jgi:hypothetical protein
MKVTIELPEGLFARLSSLALEENLTLELLIEKCGYEYLRSSAPRLDPGWVQLPSFGNGSGSVLADPSSWLGEVNERS